MASSYIDTTDAGLLTHARTLIAGVNNKPDAVGLTPAQMTAYGELTDLYNAKLAASTDRRTRGPYSISEKNTCKASLLAMTRQISMQAQNFPGTTDSQRLLLGLTVRSRTHGSVPLRIVGGRCFTVLGRSRAGGRLK